LAASFLFSSLALAGDPPAVEWETYVGGAQTDEGKDVQATSDGGFVVAGLSEN